MPKSDKRSRIQATILAAAIAALPMSAYAAGLGKITVTSALGQPLKAELEVTATAEEAQSISAKVASADAFRQAGIEYSPVLGSLRFSREVIERNGRRYLQLTTERPLNEPFIDMLVELSWSSGRLVREYTFLLDPPDLAAKTPPPAVAAPSVKPVSEPAQEQAPVAAAQPRPAPAAPATSTRVTAPPPAAAAKPAAAQDGATREVKSGDTLGKIAAQTMPEGVSLDQMLVALFRNNSDAFDGSNMNRLKAGKILTIPDAESVGQMSSEDARKIVVAQSSDFNAYRRKLAEVAAAEPAKDAVSKQAASGKIAPKVEESVPPPVAGKDKLEVSRTEAAKATKDAKGKPLEGRISNLEEDLVARDRALKDANQRVAELEKNINDLKKLAEIKSKAGAELEKQAQAAKPAAAPAPAPVPAAPVPAVAKPEPAVAAVAAPPATPPAGEAAKPADPVKPPEAVKPPPPKKKPLPPPPPPPEPTFMEENAPLVFGGGSVLALLLGWLGFSAYRKKRANAGSEPIVQADLSAHSVFSSTTVAPPPSEQEPSQFTSTLSSMTAVSDAIDPVVEADTFLAFGRDTQAEEILVEALKVDPQRVAIHHKLLEIYAGRRNNAQFESVARQLQAVTGGSGPDWSKAAAMGSALDPANALYAAAAEPVTHQSEPAAPSKPDFGATMILSTSSAAVAAATMAMPAEEVEPVAEAVVEEPEVAAAKPETAALDFDFDLGESTDAATAGAAAADAAGEVEALDFDLDLGAPEPAAEAGNAESEVAALDIDFDMPASAPAPDESALAIDLSDEAPVVTAAATEQAPAEAPKLDTSGIDFEFDLGDTEVAEPPVPALELAAPEVKQAAEPEAVSALDMDLDMDLDIDTPKTAAAPVAPAAIDLSSISLDLDTPSAAESVAIAMAETDDDAPLALESVDAADATDAADAADNAEVATKLELALAYEEMGDLDGARELYQEAVNEGSPAQRAAAKAKLDELA